MAKQRAVKIIVIIILLIALAGAILLARTFLQKPATSLEMEVLAENLHVPWALDFLPDGTLIFTERDGSISTLRNGNVVVLGTLNGTERGEGGSLGIAVDPGFVQSPFIYVYYLYEQDGTFWNRVSRLTLDGMQLAGEKVILDKIPAARFHNGGRIRFGPDGKLYITSGDATEPELAQDTSSLAGKILRINRDGSIPADNPFGNAVYSYGHRNPQGLAWHPKTKRLYATEHGPEKHDEINLITAGKNYGWPEKCPHQQFEDPLRCYEEFTLAPSGAAFIGDTLFVAGLRGAQLRQLTFAEDGSIVSEGPVVSGIGRVRDVVAHDGALYVLTSNRDGRGIPREGDDKILRLRLK